LHPHEGVARHVGHDPQRERHDRMQPDQAQGHRYQAERHDRTERGERRAAGDRVRGSRGHGIDEMAGEHRHEQIGDGRPQQAAGNDRSTGRLVQPVPKHEGQHHTYRGGALIDLSGHGVIRLRSRAHRLRLIDERRHQAERTRG
jgi:hypothetical protein